MLGLNKMITIIVPVYKVENYLSRCVDSILNQTYTDFRLILVDDGSPDNCGKMCDDYAQKTVGLLFYIKKTADFLWHETQDLTCFMKKMRAIIFFLSIVTTGFTLSIWKF